MVACRCCSGCAQRVLQPSINDATLRLLGRHGVEVVSTEGRGLFSGALVHHMGRGGSSPQTDARANIDDAWEIAGNGWAWPRRDPDNDGGPGETAIAAGQTCLFNNFLVAAGRINSRKNRQDVGFFAEEIRLASHSHFRPSRSTMLTTPWMPLSARHRTRGARHQSEKRADADRASAAL